MINRRIYSSFFISMLVFTSTLLITVAAKAGESSSSHLLYSELMENSPANMPSQEVFTLALKGHTVLKETPGTINKDILTVIDFSLTSNEKRMWIIDLENKQVLVNDYVAHGRNSGNEKAGVFSNVSGSNMSSIGFYVTGDTYHGKHGLSLFLEGMDQDFNSNARERAIVMHGADYVSAEFIKKHGRLGRSLGCPSVSMDIHKEVIQTIKDGSTLFIYYPDTQFLETSQILNKTTV